MATTLTRSLRLEDFDKRMVTAGTLELRQFNLSERALRALKFFSIFLGLAIGAVFIPVLHFVLVPAFSIAAVACGAAYFVQTEEVAAAKGVCPYCSQATTLKRAIIFKEFRDSCEHCLQLIMVTADGGRA